MNYGIRERVLNGNHSTLVAVIIVAIVLVTAPYKLGSVQTGLLITALIFAIFATAFNLLYGYTGLLSFGHAMFIAVGGYASAKFFRTIGPALGFDELFGGASVLATFVGAVILGVVLATLLAIVIGYLSVRLEEIYFAMITLSFSMAIYVLIYQNITGDIGELFGIGKYLSTNGANGLPISYSALGVVNLFGWKFKLVDILSYHAYYFIVLVFFAVSMFALWRIVRSPFGMVCRAVRENPERASALGIDVKRHSWAAFILSGAFTGLAGTLYVPFLGVANPSMAYWTTSAVPVIMAVIGGPYSFLGPAIGAFIYEYLHWAIQQFPLLRANWRFSLGVILLVFVLFFDNGVSGGIKWLWEWLGRVRAWLGSAIEHYRDDGPGGVATFARVTLTDWWNRRSLATWVTDARS